MSQNIPWKIFFLSHKIGHIGYKKKEFSTDIKIYGKLSLVTKYFKKAETGKQKC
jgi:hypothetical protein